MTPVTDLVRRLLAMLGSLGALVATSATAQEASWLTGVVRDAANSPAAGITVEVLRTATPGIPDYLSEEPSQPPVVIASTRTDERGHFLLRHAPAGRVAVVARDGTERRSEVVTPVAPGARLDLTLHPLTTLTGQLVARVTDADGTTREEPLEGVTVVANGPRRSAVPGVYGIADGVLAVDSNRTDAAGRFRLRALAGMPVTVLAGRPLGVAGRVSLTAPTDDPIHLGPEVRRVKVRVVDPEGAPVSGAEPWHRITACQPTGADGTAEWLVGSSTNGPVRAPGYRPDYVTWDAPEPTIVLEPAIQRRARLVRNGQPLVGARLRVAALAVGEGGSGPVPFSSTTDEEGRVELPGVGTEWGAVVWLDETDLFRRAFDLAAAPTDAAMDRGDIDLSVHVCAGEVRDSDGVPAAHVPLFVLPTTDPFGGRMPFAQQTMHFTDHAGRFQIRALGRTPRRIAVRSARSLTRIVEWQPGTTEPLEIRLEAAELLRGTVVDTNGSPLAGVFVHASAFQDAEELHPFGLWVTYAETDAEGRFTLAAVVPEHEHEIRTSRPGSAGTPAKIHATPGASDLEFVFPVDR